MKNMREGRQSDLDRPMIDGDERESERDLVKHQARMGPLFVGNVRFGHQIKKGASSSLLPVIMLQKE
jgi:hypothetical protein